jgi:hypothetical protein
VYEGKEETAVCKTIAVAALGLCLALTSAVRAGLYNPAEKPVWPLPEDFSSFRLLLTGLRAPALPPNVKEREPYLNRIKELTDKPADQLTVAERIEGSACYLRLNMPNEAITFLKPAEAGARGNFMVFANLATAHQMAGIPDRAISYLELALDAWPLTQEGFTPEQLKWYRKAEKNQLRLLHLRQNEAQQPNQATASVDALFARRFDFQGGDEPYEAGKDVSADDVRIVEQLLLWLPRDDRLYWLLGELLNARGIVEDAWQVMDDLYRFRNYNPGAKVGEHLHVLEEAKTPQREEAPPPAPSLQPNWWHLVISFLAGVLVSFFVGLQVRESRRRRQAGVRVREPG